jgi:hypothetical protein
METSNQAATVKIASGMMQKFIGVCMTVITLCCTLMVTFVWDLRSEFSSEKAKSENTVKVVEEVKSNVAENGKRITVLERTSDRHEEQISNLQKKN